MVGFRLLSDLFGAVVVVAVELLLFCIVAFLCVFVLNKLTKQKLLVNPLILRLEICILVI